MKRWGRWISPIAIIVFGLAIYSNNYNCGWHFDDLSYIVNNPTIRSLSDIRSIWERLTAPGRTLVLYSFALNYHFGKTDVFGYHVVNNLIHIITSLGVWWLARLIFATPNLVKNKLCRRREWAALFVALIFAAHPIQTQAITYICQRFASMATMFYVLCVASYLRGRLYPSGRWLFFLLSGLFAVCGMFSKQITITIPLAIAMIEWIFLQPDVRLRDLCRKIKWRYVLPVLGFLLIVPALYAFDIRGILSIYHASSGSYRGEPVDSYHYFLTQSRVILTYLRLLFVPIGQNLLYDFQMSKSWFEPRTLGAFLLLGCMLVSALRIRVRHRVMTFGILWFFLTLLVESSIIPIRHVIFEHRVYLPSVGFSFFIVGVMYALINADRKRQITLLIIIFTLGFLTFQRNKVWKDELTLWADVKAKSPHKMRPYLNTGIAYSERGEFDKAIYEFNRALEKNPRSIMVMNNKGVLYTKTHQFDFAIAEFNRALELSEDWPEVWNNRGDAYRHKKDYQRALDDYNVALDKKPEQYRTLSNRGVVLTHLGRYQEALEDFNAAIAVDPDFIEAYQNRGNLFGMLKRYEEAAADFTRVIQANPEVPEIYNNRGNAYRKLKEDDKALADYNRALELRPDFAEALNNRGIMYRNQKDYDRALLDYNRAIELDPNYLSALNNRANLYKLMNRNDLSIKDFNRAIGISPQTPYLYYNRAKLWIAQKNFNHALKDAERAKALGYGPAVDLVERLIQFRNAQKK